MQTNTRTCTQYFNRPVIIVPSDNIRLCRKPLDGTTTTGSSYIYHGGYRPVCNFKPKSNYVRSQAVSASETTHKLSYQPFPIERREKLPWAQKKIYRPPETGLDTFTTYSQSYIPIDGVHKEKPIKPLQNTEWLGRKYNFNGTSSYNEAFIPLPIEHVVPQIPSGNIILSNALMESETTSKLSYQKFNVQKRLPIKPRAKNTRYEGPMQTLTTNRIDYQPKVTSRPEIKIPRDNIRNSDKPIEGLTTSASAYLYYGPIHLTQSFKPVKNYQKPVGKFDDITINKLSYRPWDPVIRENYPWAQKPKYKKPTRPIDDNSIYKISFIPPEYYCYQQCEGPSCPRFPTTSQNVMCLN